MGETTTSPVFLAYLIVGAMTTAILLPFLRPVFRKWMGTARASRVRATISAALLFVFVYIGGSLDKQQRTGPFTPESFFDGQTSLRTGETSTYPQWYVDLGYPEVDTDRDGIPDYWERRTHTNPVVADAHADPDNDGVDNAEEFLHQCDPVVVDTDGDGLTDREEIDGAAAGWTGFDPILPCEYVVDASDANAWDDEVGVSFYEGQNPAGFPWNVTYPEASANNVDVCVTVDSSRHAELSWATSDGAVRLVLPPCTNLALRLRIPAGESSEVSLSSASGATGLWRASLRAEWDTRREQETERNRVRSGSGWLVDIGNVPAVFSGVLPGTFCPTNAEPARAGAPRRGIIHHNAPMPPSITMYARRANAIEGFLGCRIHGPDPVFVAEFTNPAPPFHWTVNGVDFTTATPELLCILTAETYSVGCFDSGRYTLLPLGTNAVFHVGQCQGANRLDIVGAGWSSTHNPTNALDHLPHIKQTVVEPFASMCPAYTNTVLTAGWTHNTTILWIRNLVRILTGDPWDDETDHCIAFDWSGELTINLDDYLSEETIGFKPLLFYKVNGQESAASLGIGEDPPPFHPRAFYVELCLRETGETLDRMWVVLNDKKARQLFDVWYDANSTDVSWAARLPRPVGSLTLSTNFFGRVTADDPEPGEPGQWTSPDRVSSFLHHDAKWEMRAYGNSEGHGNQACYDADGQLIHSGIAGGTADFSPGFVWTVQLHIVNDVNPFLNAVHLDGNPGDTTTWNDISRPCLHQGDSINQYLFCRPIIQP